MCGLFSSLIIFGDGSVQFGPTENARKPKKATSAKGGRLGVVLGLLALIGLGGASYFAWQLNQAQAQSLPMAPNLEPHRPHGTISL